MTTDGKERVGTTLIGVGAFLVFLGALFFSLVYFDKLPNQSWVFPWITTYRAALGAGLVGVILLLAGLWARSAFEKYTQKVSELEEARKVQDEKLTAKSIALGKARAEAERKKFALKLTGGKLKKARMRAEKEEAAKLRARGKLGDRSKRLKRIRKLTKVGKE